MFVFTPTPAYYCNARPRESYSFRPFISRQRYQQQLEEQLRERDAALNRPIVRSTEDEANYYVVLQKRDDHYFQSRVRPFTNYEFEVEDHELSVMSRADRYFKQFDLPEDAEDAVGYRLLDEGYTLVLIIPKHASRSATPAPFERKSAEPVQKPIELQHSEPSEKPAEKPTEKPAEKPTEKPTEQPAVVPDVADTPKATVAPHKESHIISIPISFSTDSDDDVGMTEDVHQKTVEAAVPPENVTQGTPKDTRFEEKKDPLANYETTKRNSFFPPNAAGEAERAERAESTTAPATPASSTTASSPKSPLLEDLEDEEFTLI